MSESIEVREPIQERPALPGSTPKFKSPRIADILAEEIKADPGKARARLRMAKNPDDKWLVKHAEVVAAAQVIVDDHFAGLDLRPYLQDAAMQQLGEDKIEALRSRVRVSKDAPVADLLLAVLQGKWTRNTILLTPLNKPIEPWVHWAQLALLRKCPWMGYDQESHPSLPFARNILATRFMESEAEWAYWLDGDTVAPFGYPDAMYHRFSFDPGFIKPEFAGLNTVERLQSRQKTIIGGLVPARMPGNHLVIQPEINPRGEDDKNLVRSLKRGGPVNKIVPVGYCGTGCLMVHKSVFADIQRKRPDLAPSNPKEPWNFFGQGSGADLMGEDMAFCKLAADCGHPSFLDLSVVCSHVGPNSFTLKAEI